ncbi:hypothetical protein ACSBR1_003624 [Camellia fascicularis]
MGFSIRREYCKKNKNLVCNKEGFRKVDKRDPLTKTPRAETRTGCEARLFVQLDVNSGKFVVIDFKEKHNHELVSLDCVHMLPSQRKISDTQAIELDLASEFGLRLGQSFELMGREVGGRQSLGFMKLDQKNYLRTKRQKSLAYGEVEAMSKKAPKTLFTDQDVAMAKAIPVVMPNTSHRLCTWHLMQNALRHGNCFFQDKGGERCIK